MTKFTTRLFFILSLFLTSISTVHACTDVALKAKDGTLLVGRTMEFATDLKSNLRNSLRDHQYISTAPNSKAGLSWKAKYGVLYLDAMNIDMAVDGMNEVGLTFEYLYLPGETKYQTVPAGKESQAITYTLLGNWILSSFKNVDEVQQALANVYVFAGTLPGLGNTVFPVHAAVYDANGKGIIIEFVNGQVFIYNSIGVLTNSPTYAWHVANLSNFLNLTPNNPNPITVNGYTYSATGQGAGMYGLPGDVSPPSRFVKTAFISKTAYQADDAAGVLNLAQHILNNVDIPTGLARTTIDGQVSSDYTQWTVFKDVTHKMIYYHTYKDMTLRSIDMTKIDFSAKGPLFKMPLEQTPYIMDFTQEFMSSKAS